MPKVAGLVVVLLAAIDTCKPMKLHVSRSETYLCSVLSCCLTSSSSSWSSVMAALAGLLRRFLGRSSSSTSAAALGRLMEVAAFFGVPSFRLSFCRCWL